LRFRAASDQAVLVYLGDEIGMAAHTRVVRLLRLLEAEPLSWVRNLQPAYCSLLVSFDACLVDHAEVEAVIREYERQAQDVALPTPRRIEIPVRYGGEFGPDLADVAEMHGRTQEYVVQLHSSQIYHAYFLGFAPGFAYLGDLPDQIATGRLETPRKKVAAGSVAIAGRQTAVYPFATPGGWRLIGQTPLNMFRTDREPMGLISMGDEVKFSPITPAQFQNWGKP
jgi:KipI family sensor histidine kinase inhibitor